nr:MAG: internal scaffolding protein [Microvirus sp.]
MKKFKIQSAYDGARVAVTVEGGESMVRTEFQEEANINTILARYETTGMLPLESRQPIFADVSMMEDLKSSMDTVAAVEGRLKELPREARELFAKDPGGFAQALSEPLTRERLQDLGVLEREPEVEVPPVPAIPEVIPVV